MNCKRIILLFLALLQAVYIFSQRVEYAYDENGNRLSRKIIVEELKSNTVQFPIVNPKNLQTNKDYKAKSLDFGGSSSSVDSKAPDQLTRDRIKTEDEPMITTVYPNPNRGLIRVKILNMPLNAASEIRLYDLNGNELVVKRNFESDSEIDITKYNNGIYILRIKVNDKKSDWKIIKGN